MKIKEVMFYGFSKTELEQVRKETGRDSEEEYTPVFAQEVADAVQADVITITCPDGRILLVKGGAA